MDTPQVTLYLPRHLFWVENGEEECEQGVALALTLEVKKPQHVESHRGEWAGLSQSLVTGRGGTPLRRSI